MRGIRVHTFLGGILLLLLISSTVFSDETSFCSRLWNWVSFDCRPDSWRQSCRKCTANFFKNRKQPKYGLELGGSLDDVDRAVIFVHGWNSRPEDLKPLIELATQQGLRCLTFRYPNDQAISESARLFRRALNQLRRDYPATRLSIVTHSMGGLVARDVIEDPRQHTDQVDRMIMIVPPNHGSHLAKYACSVDVYEYASSETRRREADFFVGSILDGLSEATRDMRPGSSYLMKLNSRPRKAHIRYTIILGTDGILTQFQLQRLKTRLDEAARKCRWFQPVSEKLAAKAIKYDEIIDGQGDGLVSVQSGRLTGVEDIVMGHFSHTDVLNNADRPEVKRIRSVILERLLER